MSSLYRFSFALFNLWIILGIACPGAQATKAIITRPEALFAPEGYFYNAEGQKLYLDQYERKTTLLVVFWATWCGSCVSEMASLENLQKDFRQLPFEILAISEDQRGINTVADFYRLQQIRHLAIYHDHQNQLFKAFEVAGLPTAFLIDQNGQIKIIFRGIIKWHDETIRTMILAEIAGNSMMPKNSYKSNSLNNIVPQEHPIAPTNTENH